jgi:hypothetical protein
MSLFFLMMVSCRSLLVWWLAEARRAASSRQGGQARELGEAAAAHRKAGDAELEAAERCLEQAGSSHTSRKLRVDQARRHLGEAKLKFIDAGCVSQERVRLEALGERIKGAEQAAGAAEAGDDAMEDAEGALADERWEDVDAACARAREAYESSGSIDQLYVVDELEERCKEARRRADMRRSAEKAGKSAYSALKDGNLEKAQDKAARSTQLYGESGFPVPKKYLAVFRDVEAAVKKKQAAAHAAEGDAALEEADSMVDSLFQKKILSPRPSSSRHFGESDSMLESAKPEEC